MIDFNLPAPTPTPVDLLLDTRQIRKDKPDLAGDSASAPAPAPEPVLAGRVAVGGPVAAKVSKAMVDADPALAAFVESQEATSRYMLLHLAVTFQSTDDDPPLESASVEFKLTSESGALPIAWSMAPAVVSHPSQIAQTVKIGPQLKLFGVEASGLSVERSRTYQSDEVFLEALRELRSDPAWEFSRTRTMTLRGSHRLIMIAQGPRGTSAKGEIKIRAAVRRRHVFSYRAALDPITLPFDF